MAAAPATYSRHGRLFDVYGDVASNDGEAGHQTRHYHLLLALHKILKSVWGGSVRREPPDYRDYSTTRPDLAATGGGRRGGLWLGDLKLFGPIGSDGTPPIRGAMVAFGCTLPAAQGEDVRAGGARRAGGRAVDCARRHWLRRTV